MLWLILFLCLGVFSLAGLIFALFAAPAALVAAVAAFGVGWWASREIDSL